MLTIPSHYLKAALTHAADRDVRAYLNCVRVEVVSTGEVYIVATDGARACSSAACQRRIRPCRRSP